MPKFQDRSKMAIRSAANWRAEHQELLEDEDEGNPMFTPKRSNKHKATCKP